LLFAIAGLALIPATAATFMRVLPPEDDATARVAAFVPYGLLGYLLALVCLLLALVRARRRLLPAVITVAVMALAASHVAWLAPVFVADDRAAATPRFRLMTLNMDDGEADSGEVAERVAQADIVILVETTYAALTGLKLHGWDRRFPVLVGRSTRRLFLQHRSLLPVPAEPQHADRQYLVPAVGDHRANSARWRHPADGRASMQSILRR
jgi:hypothetical protein